MVNEQYKGKFDMADVLLYQAPEYYKEHTKNSTDDVQIFYGGAVGDVEAVGHYICVFYKHSERRVYVYDSLVTKSLTKTQQKILDTLYPLAKYFRFVKPKTTQKDSTSCGIFSIAYATTLILGEDPKKVSFKLERRGDQSMIMRNHVKKMLTNGKLSLFPA